MPRHRSAVSVAALVAVTVHSAIALLVGVWVTAERDAEPVTFAAEFVIPPPPRRPVVRAPMSSHADTPLAFAPKAVTVAAGPRIGRTVTDARRLGSIQTLVMAGHSGAGIAQAVPDPGAPQASNLSQARAVAGGPTAPQLRRSRATGLPTPPTPQPLPSGQPGGRVVQRPQGQPGGHVVRSETRHTVRPGSAGGSPQSARQQARAYVPGPRSNQYADYVPSASPAAAPGVGRGGAQATMTAAAGESYDPITENSFRSPMDEPLSTFSIDVDTASYSNVRRFITQGIRPPADAVRVEELINYFHYDYPDPDGDDAFAVYTEVGDAPWRPEHRLVHIGLQGRRIDHADRPASNLVFLLDVSGSMQPLNKLPLLKRAFQLLVGELDERDRVAIVTYAGHAGVALPPTSGAQKQRILEVVAGLGAGGSTGGAEGIRTAYELARRSFIPGGINRVILATDGDFNVGISSDSALVSMIEEKRKGGVFLTILGFGEGNLKDAKMHKLADKGNGTYHYIDSIFEVKKVLVDEMGATLQTIAKDVKIQVEFNPAHVAAYRLVGYETRLLAAEDFADDRKDAGELGAGHTVTALYEVVPRAVSSPALEGLGIPLKYQRQDLSDAAEHSGELLTVKLRYKQPDGDVSKLLSRTVDAIPSQGDSTASYRFSAAVALFGMLLRDSPEAGDATVAGGVGTRAPITWRRRQGLSSRVRGHDGTVRGTVGDQRQLTERNGGEGGVGLGTGRRRRIGPSTCACGMVEAQDGTAATVAGRTRMSNMAHLASRLSREGRSSEEGGVRPWTAWVVLLLAVVSYAHAAPKVAYTELVDGWKPRIRILDLADGSVKPFTDDRLDEYGGSWGPLGDRLVAAGKHDGAWHIFHARVGSADRTWLTEGPNGGTEPVWSPDGRRVAFSSARGGQGHISVVDIDGENLRRVSNDRGLAAKPSWSPDGSSLVYLCWDNLADSVGVVRMVDVRTGKTRSLTPEDELVRDPALSWDGKYIVFSTDLLYVEVMTLDGRDRWRVTDGLGPDGIFPAWTPDGEISFVLARGRQDDQVAVTGLHGGDEEALTDTPTRKVHLAWYNARWFPVQALTTLQPKLWAGIKR